MEWLRTAVSIAPILYDRIFGRRAELSVDQAASTATTSGRPSAVPFGQVHVSMHNAGRSDAADLVISFRSSWVTDWTDLTHAPERILAGAKHVRIPVPPIPEDYAEKMSGSPDTDVWFEMRIKYTDGGMSRPPLAIKQRYRGGIYWRSERSSGAPTRRLSKLGRTIVILLLAASLFCGYRRYCLRSVLADYGTRDRVLTESLLAIQEKGNMTRVDYFDKARENIQAREAIIYDLQTLRPVAYRTEIQRFARLLAAENSCFQSYILLETAYMQLESADAEAMEAFHMCEDSGFPNSLYGRMVYEQRYRPASRRAKESGDSVAERQEGMLVSIEDWLHKEQEFSGCLPALFPRGDIAPSLERARAVFVDARQKREALQKALEKTQEQVKQLIRSRQ